MKVAVISFDTSYVEKLRNIATGTEIYSFTDTISFLKKADSIKPEVIIYDTSSGIFAEDDLRYLLSKNIVESGKIIGLTTPENSIDNDIFEQRVIFFDKNEQFNEIVNIIKTHAPMEKSENPELEIDNLLKESLKMPTRTEKPEHIEIDFSTIGDIDELESSLKVEPSIDIEPTHLDFDIEYNDINMNLEQKQKIDTSNNIGIGKDMENIENPITLIPATIDKVMEQAINTGSEESRQQNIYKNEIEDIPSMEKFSVKDLNNHHSLQGVEEKKTITGNNILGGEIMIANFNIKISEEDIKNLALQMAREFLEKDPAMEKIVDHLQIDFQDETMKELDRLRTELRDKLRREMEIKVSREIERLIKGELKDLVAEIAARTIKEKIEQMFKAF